MALEAATFVAGLVSTNPPSGDDLAQGDDHLRLIKQVLLTTFPNATKPFYFPGHATKTTNYVVLVSDDNKIFSGDSTGGDVTFTLPTVGIVAGFSVVVTKSDSSANDVILAPNTGTISGAASLVLTSQFAGALAFWTGSTWIALRFVTNTIEGTITFADEVVFNDVVTFNQGIEFNGPLQIDEDSTFNDKAIFNALLKMGKETVGDGATVTLNFLTQPYKVWTAAGNRTLAAPSNEEEGQLVLLNAKQDAAGNRVPTFNAAFKFSGGPVVNPDLAALADTFYLMVARGADDIITIPLWMSNFPRLDFYKDINLGNLDNNDTLSAAHGIGHLPSGVQFYLKCLVTQAGYAVGDYITIASHSNNGVVGITSGFNLTDVFFTTDDNVRLKQKGNGDDIFLTQSSWDVIARVYF